MEILVKRSLHYTCILSYTATLLIFVLVSIKIINIRSQCTSEKANITKLVKQIEELKEENNRLNIDFYKKLKPKTVDSMTKNMNLLHENEVKYLR